MAGIDLGGGNKRAVNQTINMVPFIDLLMVTIAFLLVSAVWVTHSRVLADAQVPGGSGDITAESVTLHVYAQPSTFDLVWKMGSTVIDTTSIKREPNAVAHPELETALVQAWAVHGKHTDPSDRSLDRCVLHTEDREKFKDMVAIMDAIHAPTRDQWISGKKRPVSAFRMALAVR